ncbi:MAG: M28 family metallopeptidase [Bdellovibrionales bacterium]
MKAFRLCLLGILFPLVLNASTNPPVFQIATQFSEGEFHKQLEILTGVFPIPVGPSAKKVLPDRYTTESMKYVRQYLAQYLTNLGYDVRVEQFDVTLSKRHQARDPQGYNLVVEIPGQTQEIVMLGAHYDTTGVNRPGANDNATGVAAVLEAARVFKHIQVKPLHTIRLVLFDAEELKPYFLGSAAHLEHSRKLKEKIKLFVNLDMLGDSRTEAGLFALFDRGEFESVGALVENVNKKSQNPIQLESWGPYYSDHQSGIARGVPSVSLAEKSVDPLGNEAEYYKFYHKDTDTIEKVNIPYAARLGAFATAIVFAASQSEDSYIVTSSRLSHVMRNFFERLKFRWRGNPIKNISDAPTTLGVQSCSHIL